jgi:valyl-tRNA synthetase
MLRFDVDVDVEPHPQALGPDVVLKQDEDVLDTWFRCAVCTSRHHLYVPIPTYKPHHIYLHT